MKKTGFFWHVHHKKLLEWCYDYDERVEYIQGHKPTSEKELRLRLLRPVRGVLPRNLVEAWQAYDGARLAYDKARRAFHKAWQVHHGINLVNYPKARQNCENAWQNYEYARQNCERAQLLAYDVKIKIKDMPAIEALHREECPNCPWDGRTILPDAW